MNETVIAMQTFSNLLMIEIELWNTVENIYKPLFLTFDTGASVTTISTEILCQLGYEPNDKGNVMITTASDVVRVAQYKMDKMKIGDIEIMDIDVYAHKFPEECFSLGVIGLNVLRYFDIELLFSKKLIKLKRIFD